MNNDDFVKIARQFGMNSISGDEHIIAFARLIAAAEREACAKACESINLEEGFYQCGQAIECADAIRSRT